MDYKLVLDIIMAALLAATIAYAALLNQKLTQLRKNRDDMARMVNAFNEATARAEQGIPKLRRATEDAGAALQERVEKAQALRDDLAFMIERADAIANRLEGSVRNARSDGPSGVSSPAASAGRAPTRAAAAPAPAPPPVRATRPATSGFDDDGDERSEAERELLRALHAIR